jgi:hypothetical protein
VINHLQDKFKEVGDVGITYIYCDYKDQLKQTALGLLSSIARQLLERRPALLPQVKDFQKKCTDSNTRPTLKDYSELLSSMVRQFSQVYLMVDALDECAKVDGERNTNRHSFVNELKKLQSSTDGSLHLLITSRPLPEIGQDLEGAAKLEIRASDEDITTYVNWKISDSETLTLYTNEDFTLKKEINDSLLEKCHDVYVSPILDLSTLLATNLSVFPCPVSSLLAS